MRRLVWGILWIALAAVLLVSASSGAAGTTVRQRVMIEQKHQYGARAGTFALSVLSDGQLESDAGSYTYAALEKPPVVRDGQGAAVYVAIATLTGGQGSLVLRWRVEFVGAGDGITVGTGTWSVTRGTGAYSAVTGKGRLAAVVVSPAGRTSLQLEGHLRVPSP